MDYNTVKALHIIFVVSWFAGLFYIVRLFIYHTEAGSKNDLEKTILTTQFKIMESRLWWIITTPAMVFTLFFGTWMLILNPSLLQQGWMHVKLTFIVLLLIYHFICQSLMSKLKNDTYTWKSSTLRIWNEVATLCLVAIVFLVTLKNSMNWIYGTISFFAVAVSLMILIKIYKKYRPKT